MKNDTQFQVRDMRHKGKFQIDDVYLNGYAKKVGVYGSAVYMSLCRHADTQQKCWPSIKKLAEEHDCSEKQISRAIKSLEDLNIIKKLRLGKKLVNRYYLLDKSEWTNSPITKTSEETHSPIIADSQSYHQGTDSPFHIKETQLKETQYEGIVSKDTNDVSNDINTIIGRFSAINANYASLYKIPAERKAIAEMLKLWKEDDIKYFLDNLQKLHEDKYFPKAVKPTKWLQKQAEIYLYLKNLKPKVDRYANLRKVKL